MTADPPRGEFELIRGIAARVPKGAGVVVGIGDDCAVLRHDADHDLLLTTDLLLEGRHFLLAGLAPEDLGWKALAVSVSDVAAMGGEPRHAVLSLALRPEQTGRFADRLVAGLLDCAQRFGVALVGGDTTGTPGPVVVNVALTGRVERGRAILRSGARPGDAVCVTGALGGSLLGRHLRPEPRQSEARTLVQGGAVHAMIDLSDGLSSDLGHLADASGAGAEVWSDRVPVHADARRAAASDGRDPLAHALDDGEDFELCFTTSPERAAELVAEGLAGTPVSWVGRITERPGLRLLRGEGDEAGARELPRRGHDHFRGA